MVLSCPTLMVVKEETATRGGLTRTFLSGGSPAPTCVVVTAEPERFQGMSARFARSGWQIWFTDLANEAVHILEHVDTQLVIVELARAGAQGDDYLDLCREVPRRWPTLLVICGHEEDATEEIWARQLGAWLYIPGLTVDGFGDVLDYARPLAEQHLAGAVSV